MPGVPALHSLLWLLQRDGRKSSLNVFHNLAVYSCCLQMSTRRHAGCFSLYSGFRSPTLSWGLVPDTWLSLQPFGEKSLSRAPAQWPFLVSIWSTGNLGSLAPHPTPPSLERACLSHCCSALRSCHCGRPQFSCLSASPGNSQQSLCSNEPTISWGCLSAPPPPTQSSCSDCALLDPMQDLWDFICQEVSSSWKHVLAAQRFSWASISWLGNASDMKSKLDLWGKPAQ